MLTIIKSRMSHEFLWPFEKCCLALCICLEIHSLPLAPPLTPVMRVRYVHTKRVIPMKTTGLKSS